MRGESLSSKNLNFVPEVWMAGELAASLHRVACFRVRMLLTPFAAHGNRASCSNAQESRGSQDNEGNDDIFLLTLDTRDSVRIS